MPIISVDGGPALGFLYRSLASSLLVLRLLAIAFKLAIRSLCLPQGLPLSTSFQVMLVVFQYVFLENMILWLKFLSS